jgi:hypothetical protein
MQMREPAMAQTLWGEIADPLRFRLHMFDFINTPRA